MLLSVRAVLIFILIFVPLLLINVIQILSFAVYPFSKVGFRKVNTFLAGSWWSSCENIMKWLGVDVVLSGDKVPQGENVILISNHQGWGDIPVLFKLAKETKQIGHMKWFVKDVLKYVPGVGWGMLFLDCLFVKRNWHKDKEKIEGTFRKFFENNIPIWLMIFPEGTRFRPHKLKRMEKIARKKNLPALSYVLYPRPRGFVASVQALRGHCQAVYDVTIIYEGEVPTFSDLFLGKVKKVNLHVRRFELDSLSDDRASLNDWIMERFCIKNKMIADSRSKWPT